MLSSGCLVQITKIKRHRDETEICMDAGWRCFIDSVSFIKKGTDVFKVYVSNRLN